MKPVMRYQSQLLYRKSYKPNREERIRSGRKQFIRPHLGAAPSAVPHPSARRLPCTQNPDNPMTTTIVATLV
jgi:hypothetical protein